MTPTLMLLDGHALVHRAFHAIRPLTTREGELVNAVYGFTAMLLKVMADFRPEYIAVAFDRAAPTFRHVEYEAYKAQRPKTPEELSQQFARVRQVVAALGIPIHEVDGFEADDVLGTLARQATEKDVDTLVVTGDADALQLVGPRVRVLMPHQGFSETMLYDEAAVQARYGVAPAQVPDFKALKGDPSDNIKGVRGIGDKGAARLLQQFGTLENLLAHRAELDPKTAAALATDEQTAVQSKRLATIVTSAPVALDLEACRVGRDDRPRLLELLRELQFRSLLNRLPPADETGADQPTVAQPSLFAPPIPPPAVAPDPLSTQHSALSTPHPVPPSPRRPFPLSPRDRLRNSGQG